MAENKKTCLYDKHVALGAMISPFGGFDMPIQYSNIKDEHLAVRQKVGIFDVSHMGEVEITGPEAEKFVQKSSQYFRNQLLRLSFRSVLHAFESYC